MNSFINEPGRAPRLTLTPAKNNLEMGNLGKKSNLFARDAIFELTLECRAKHGTLNVELEPGGGSNRDTVLNAS